MKKLLDELTPMIEDAVTKSEEIRKISGGGLLILPRQALYLINKLQRLVDEAAHTGS